MRGDQGRRLEGNRPGTGPEVEDLLSWGEGSAPDDLLDYRHKALIDLTLVDRRIAVPDPTLPNHPFTITIGW
jgi:hypothetical protein